MYTINMISKADSVKGQGVGSAYLEQVALVQEELNDRFFVTINKKRISNIMHYHTINFPFVFTIPFAKVMGTAIGYVHFLPETLDESIHLPKIIKNIFYWYVIRFYKSMDLLVTVNPCFIDKLAKYGIDRRKITYIPNYVSQKDFYPIKNCNKAQLKAKYNLDPNKFTVLTVGQLQIRKGIMEFVSLSKKMPDVQFVWAGDFSFGKISDGYDKIKYIRSNPPSNVTFLGFVEREKMNELYNMADVMFLPSYNELFPMTVLESMNCGIPILLRDLELYKDILFDFYLKGHDNDDFNTILRKLQNDTAFYQKAKEMSFQGGQFYCREHVAQMWSRFYRKAACYKKKFGKNSRYVKKATSQNK